MTDEDKQAITDAVRAVLMSDEFLTAFVAKWMKTPLPMMIEDYEPISGRVDK